jgi:hypothetical protein
MIRNIFICFVCGWSIHPKKKNDGNLASCAMMQFPVIFFFGWILPSTNKKIKSFLKSLPPWFESHCGRWHEKEPSLLKSMSANHIAG